MGQHLFDGMLREILELPTAPFCEDAVSDHVLRTLKKWDVPYRCDTAGNVIAHLRRGRVGPPLALAAHMDHPGFRVESVISSNVACVRMMGGVGRKLIGYRVRFFGNASGVGKVIRELKKDARGVPEAVLVKTTGRAPASGIAGMWDIPVYAERGNMIFARAIDDVAGVAVMLEVLRRLRKIRPPRLNLYCCFTRAEEVGFVGAAALAHNGILPKSTRIISIEMSKALPRVAEQGRGFVVRIGDLAGVFEPRLCDLLITTARAMRSENEKFRFQTAVLDGGSCEATLFNVLGYSSAGVALPLGNYHNRTPTGGVAPEFIDRRDLAGLADFLTELPRRMAQWDPNRSALKRRLQKNFRKWKKYL